MISRLETGNSWTFFYGVLSCHATVRHILKSYSLSTQVLDKTSCGLARHGCNSVSNMSSLIFWLVFYSHTWETLSISSSARLLLLSSFSGSLVSILFTSSTTFLDTFFLGDVVLVFFFGDPRFITKYNYILLKGQCHEIFCFNFFQWIIFPRAPENNTRVKSIFFNIHGDIRKSRCTTGINDTGSKFANGVNYTGCKKWEQNQTR